MKNLKLIRTTYWTRFATNQRFDEIDDIELDSPDDLNSSTSITENSSSTPIQENNFPKKKKFSATLLSLLCGVEEYNDKQTEAQKQEKRNAV